MFKKHVKNSNYDHFDIANMAVVSAIIFYF